jgi:predicted Zn finger-like uncharacterized protein
MGAARGLEAMITHCPSCNTHFRVHAEQLAARAGQVRCGKCTRVFDALEHLIEEGAFATAPLAGPDSLRTAAAEVEHAPEPAAAEAQAPPIAEAALEMAPEANAESPQAGRSEPRMSEPVILGIETATGASSFDFGPAASAESAKPRRRWPWLLGAILLLCLLVAQAAYQYRGAITLLFPETKPYAAALCAKLGCDLPLPRRIELMSIEASDLQADTTNPSVMVLSATLKNRAIFNQQHPLLELTLTDAQDQPVVRRVLAPPDYLGKALSTQAGFGANTEIAIKVFIEGSQVKATGYRLYLFYP